MNTYGLNRHLNSFGLSYPGYWFIIIGDVGESIPFIAYGTRNYIAYELRRLFPAYEITIYEAKRGGVITLNRYYHAEGLQRFEADPEPRLLVVLEASRVMNASEHPRNYVVEDENDFTASAMNRAFVAQVNREYEL